MSALGLRLSEESATITVDLRFSRPDPRKTAVTKERDKDESSVQAVMITHFGLCMWYEV